MHGCQAVKRDGLRCTSETTEPVDTGDGHLDLCGMHRESYRDWLVVDPFMAVARITLGRSSVSIKHPEFA